MFDIGRTVIDKKRDSSPTVVGIIENSYSTVYVLEDDGECYLTLEENLIEYNKYYFTDKEEN